MHEYTTLERLSRAGLPVPTPLAASDNAVLMSYFGSRSGAAPTLSEVGLETEDAVPLFEEMVRSMASMLQAGVIHGDLSAYNLLFWEGKLHIIDFPQVTDPTSNPNAYSIFARDVARVFEYFERQGVQSDRDLETLIQDLWRRGAADD
jgi:RIO kinase 1